MRDLAELDHLRDRITEARFSGGLSESGEKIAGVCRVPVKSSKRPMLVILSTADAPRCDGWDHVSVSLPGRCPTWEEMCHTKALFFRDNEWVMQLHPPESENISNHPYCLHLWRPTLSSIPLPPAHMVGIKELGTLK